MAGPALQAPAYLYCTQADVEALLSTAGVESRLTDEGEQVPTTTESNYLTVQGLNYAASRVNFFCQSRYEGSELQKSYLVNEWATLVAARWLCARRGNPVPESIKEMYDEAVEDLKSVRAGQFQIPDIGSRDPDFPAYSNLTLRPEFLYRRVRREKTISDNTPAGFPRADDIPSTCVVEP